jgi:hypothetical protein
VSLRRGTHQHEIYYYRSVSYSAVQVSVSVVVAVPAVEADTLAEDACNSVVVVDSRVYLEVPPY